MKYFKIYVTLAVICAALAVVLFCIRQPIIGTIALILALGCSYFAYKLHRQKQAQDQQKDTQDQADQKVQQDLTEEKLNSEKKFQEATQNLATIEKLLKDNPNSYDLQIKKRDLMLIINDYQGINEYVCMPGYEITDYKSTETLVRGAHHYIDASEYADLYSGLAVLAKHSPTTEYPELTEYCIGYLCIGTMKQDMAEDFVSKYGHGFIFKGELIKKTRVKNEAFNPELDEDEDNCKYYYNLVVKLELPILHKIKDYK